MDTLSTESNSTLSTPDAESSGCKLHDPNSMDAAISSNAVKEDNASQDISRERFIRNEFFIGNPEITIRDASSVAVSECTKPDPPSIIDHVLIEDVDHSRAINVTNKDSRSKLVVVGKTASSTDFEVVVSTMANTGRSSRRLFKEMSSLDGHSNSSQLQESPSNLVEDKLNASIHSSSSDKNRADRSVIDSRYSVVWLKEPNNIGHSRSWNTNGSSSSPINQAILDDGSKSPQNDFLIKDVATSDLPILKPREPAASNSDTLLGEYTRNNFDGTFNLLSRNEATLEVATKNVSDLNTEKSELATELQKRETDRLSELGTINDGAAIVSSDGKVVQKKSSKQDPVVHRGTWYTPHNMTPASSNGKRKISLRLEEELRNPQKVKGKGFRNSFLGHIRRRSSGMMIFGSNSTPSIPSIEELQHEDEDSHVPRGKISVSWYEGTSSLELHEHVRRCITRKLMKTNTEEASFELEDLRILDEDSDPVEEVVLSPHIPDGSSFICRFAVRDLSNKKDGTFTPVSEDSVVRASLSPGIGPSPHPDKNIFDGLSSKQLEIINDKLNASIRHQEGETNHIGRKKNRISQRIDHEQKSVDSAEKSIRLDAIQDASEDIVPDSGENVVVDKKDIDDEASDDVESDTLLHSADPIEARFREIFQLLLTERKKSRTGTNAQNQQQEKRQVIFVVSNYLVLFLAVLAICAELQARVPTWLQAMERQILKVHNCGATQEALFECVSRGDLAGLLASIGLWFSRSLADKRIFLFGFESPKKLWTVVYESLVTAVCWGISHLFIRRGLNPDTRERFVQRHWKDTLYGSLAVVHAAFLKLVLKNLIPQEVVEVAFKERQIKILSWLPSFAYEK